MSLRQPGRKVASRILLSAIRTAPFGRETAGLFEVTSSAT
jgi:hypothetical protein